MKDRIYLEALTARCRIGIFDWERKILQKVVVDLDFPADAARAARRDRIEATVDYKKIAKHVLDYVSKSRFGLIETLADRLARSILKKFGLPEIRLRVSKPGAVRHSKNVAVEVMRRKR